MSDESSVASGFGFAIGAFFAIALLLVIFLVGCPLVCATGTGLAIVGAAKEAEESRARTDRPTVVTKMADGSDAVRDHRPALDVTSPEAMIAGLLKLSPDQREAELGSLLHAAIEWRLDGVSRYKFNKKSGRRWIDYSSEHLKVKCLFALRPEKAVRAIKTGENVVVTGRIQSIDFKAGEAAITISVHSTKKISKESP